MDFSEVLVVVRSSGEKTKEECVRCLNKYFLKENIVLIEDYTPFSEAIKATFKEGIKRNKKWTLVVDADVLVNSNIMKFIKACEEHLTKHKRVYVYNPLLYDKFLMTYRIVGIHLYNTKYLRKALKFINKSKFQLRPETYIKKEMHMRGYNAYFSNMEVGIHDFFQYYKDIFRKGILHANKHREVDDLLYAKWEKLKEADEEFLWICKGVQTASKISDHVVVDINFFEKYMQENKKYNDIEKKPNITKVEEMLNKYKREEQIQILRTWSMWQLYKEKYLNF